mgnify:CR=1 FL=1
MNHASTAFFCKKGIQSWCENKPFEIFIFGFWNVIWRKNRNIKFSRMKNTTLIILIFTIFTSLGLHAQTAVSQKEEKLVWYTDIVKANEVSKASNKPLFAFFTGSDWCGWCRKMQNDVFSKPEFIQWAQKNVVLLELDFPRNKVLSPELVQQNASLQQAFQVQGYPTIWMFFLEKKDDGLNYNIQSLGSLGYPQGAEKGNEQVKFLETANLILEKK